MKAMDKIEKKFWLSIIKRLSKMLTGVEFQIFKYRNTIAINFTKGKEKFLLDKIAVGTKYDINKIVEKVKQCLLD